MKLILSNSKGIALPYIITVLVATLLILMSAVYINIEKSLEQEEEYLDYAIKVSDKGFDYFFSSCLDSNGVFDKERLVSNDSIFIPKEDFGGAEDGYVQIIIKKRDSDDKVLARIRSIGYYKGVEGMQQKRFLY